MANRDQVGQYLEQFARNKRRALDALAEGAQSGEESAGPPHARQRAAQEGIRAIQQNKTPSDDQIAAVEAIILPKIRPVLDVVDGAFHTDHPLWQHLNTDAAIRQRLQTAIKSIGRVELPGNDDIPYGGTGFVIGDKLIMTNRHVAAIFASGVGTRSLSFRPGSRAGIDFRRELDRPTGPTLEVRRVLMIHPYWDMALLEVDDLPDGVEPLRLSQQNPTGANMIEVAAIGYPAFDTRNPTDVQNDLFRKVFGVKRLQPGTLGGRQSTESFGKMVDAHRHNCSTLGGNSGSALIDLKSGEVLALHFGGRFEKINYGVPGFELARDGRVVDAGVTFATAAPSGTPPWSDWWRDADADVIVTERATSTRVTLAARATQQTVSMQNGAQHMPDGSIQICVPLSITVRLGCAQQAYALTTTTPAAAGPGITEAMVMPFHDEDYDTRDGYQDAFLGDIVVPMPKPATPADVAKTKDGGEVLHYQNFSVVMHAKRRMALFTASNVTAEAKLKKPEPGRKYTRKALSGLGDNDQERWFPDPRLDDEFQLPDVFYTRDDGAFDKGHIVRREDVAWGETYNVLRIANGDTYHVTNCSPQVAGFNRSTLGDDNWGDLEDHVLKGAASERYCQFAGPVLDPADEVFVGRAGGTARIRVKIPSRYWKVIVVKTSDGIASFGFVLDQDLSDVPLGEEEFVAARFKRFMVPLKDLQKQIGATFPDVVLNADQHDTNEGVELALRAGIRRDGASVVSEEGVIL